MKVLLLIPISIFIIFIPSIIPTFAIPADQNSAMLKSSVLPIPAYENNSFFAIDSSFGGYEAYFVESNSNKIGCLIPATNTITEWNIPTKSSLSVSISVDSSTSNVYFVESNSNKIGRLVPLNNFFKEWTLKGKLDDIDVDSTGSIHFINTNETRIYRLG